MLVVKRARDIHIDRAIALLIVLHIRLLISIALYCAVLPVPGPEEGGGGNHVFHVSMFYGSCFISLVFLLF